MALAGSGAGGASKDWRGAAPVTEDPLSAENYRRRTIGALNKLTADNITSISDRVLATASVGAQALGVTAVRDIALMIVGEASDADNFAEMYSRLALRLHQ